MRLFLFPRGGNLARRRYLSTKISLDLDINRLDDFTALLYTWLIPHAEDDCSLPTEPEVIAAMVMPLRNVKPEKIQAAVNQMLDVGLLLLNDGKLRFEPSAFYRYQTCIHADRRWGSSEEQRKTAQNSASFSFSSSVSSSVSASADAPPTKIGKDKSNFPNCFLAEIERDGHTTTFRGHLLRDLQEYAGTWPAIPKNQGKLGAAIRDGCDPACDGKNVRRCASALLKHARSLHQEFAAKNEPFPTELFLYKAREGSR